MKRTIETDFDKESGICVCYLVDKAVSNEPFIGAAICALEDRDMMSEFTGGEIASRRALIKYLKFLRDHVANPQLKSLKMLLDNVKTSTHFNKKSYEAIMLFRAYNRAQEDYNGYCEDIKEEEKALKEYIDGKEKLFQKMRALKDADKKEK